MKYIGQKNSVLIYKEFILINMETIMAIEKEWILTFVEETINFIYVGICFSGKEKAF